MVLKNTKPFLLAKFIYKFKKKKGSKMEASFLTEILLLKTKATSYGTTKCYRAVKKQYKLAIKAQV